MIIDKPFCIRSSVSQQLQTISDVLCQDVTTENKSFALVVFDMNTIFGTGRNRVVEHPQDRCLSRDVVNTNAVIPSGADIVPTDIPFTRYEVEVDSVKNWVATYGHLLDDSIFERI